MPLKDHFHPPLSELRHWESFHARWATVIADTLEADLLPPGYFAEVQVHVGRVEVDIAAFVLGSESLYAVSYRPLQNNDTAEIHVWHEELNIGENLPAMPLPLDRGQCIRMDLEATYTEACLRTRLPRDS